MASKFLLVQTVSRKGERFGLMDASTGQDISAFRPTVVARTGFVTQRLGLGQLEILLNDLPDVATDADFVKYLDEAKGDVTKAVEDFDLAMKALSAEPVEVVAPPKTTATKGK